jgi:RND superfamily putative drug exporter
MKLTTGSLARESSRRPWTTVGVWVLLIAVAGWLSSMWLGDALTSEGDFTNRPESKRALELVEERFGREGVSEIFIMRSDDATVDDKSFREYAAAKHSKAESLDGEVKDAVSYFDTQDPGLVSDNGHTALMSVTFVDDGDLTGHENEVAAIRKAGDAEGFETLSFGDVTANKDVSAIAEEDLAKGETFGLLIALVVLVAVFGAIVAGLIPIAVAIASIAVALGIVAAVGQFFAFSFFVTNMLTMMGLAVGIDYSLFIVSRYREERGQGHDKLDAIALAGNTASRAVFFSGVTVVVALIGMLIVPTVVFRSLAAGAIFVVLVSVLASLTLLPALLRLLGDRVNSLRVFRRKSSVGVADSHRFWDGITHRVMRRPVMSLVVVGGALLIAASSYLDINTGSSGITTLPDETMSKRAFNALSADFAGGLDTPVEIVVDGEIDSPEARAGIEKMQELLAADDLFGASKAETNAAGDLAVISAPVNGDPSTSLAADSIERIRTDYVSRAFGDVDEVEVLVGGFSAFNKDFLDLTDSYTPIVFILVLGTSFILLTIVFRSIVVPIKAIVMNLLSVGAAYGLVVLVNQKGFAADLLGFQQVESIEAWIPLFLFSVLFGLSMDYHVFLLSRIRERFDLTHENSESVAYGLRTTGGLITGAALIMVAVFGGFAAGELVMFQQMGFGLAVAVFLDATLVRSVLVPASMKLLGDRNWYLPKWLGWLPKINIEGDHHEMPAQIPRPEPALEGAN